MQAFLAKFYETVIIVMAVFLLLAISALGVQSWRVNHFKSEYTLLNAKYNECSALNDAKNKALK